MGSIQKNVLIKIDGNMLKACVTHQRPQAFLIVSTSVS